MSNDTMFYKAPGPHEIHGGHFDYTIVDADDDAAVAQAIKDGWHLTTDAAKEAAANVAKKVSKSVAKRALEEAKRLEEEAAAALAQLEADAGEVAEGAAGEVVQAVSNVATDVAQALEQAAAAFDPAAGQAQG